MSIDNPLSNDLLGIAHKELENNFQDYIGVNFSKEEKNVESWECEVWYTPYQFAENEVITSIDIEGAEPQYIVDVMKKYNENFFNAIEAANNIKNEYC